MKKILIFSLNYYPKFIGGAEVAIKEITDRISPDDISFDMVTLRFDSDLPKVEKIGNVTVYRIGFARKGPTIIDLRKFPLHLNKFYFQFAAAIKALSLHKKNNYDALWAMMAHSCAVPVALFSFRFPKVPYLLTLQEGDPPEHIKRTMLPLYPLFVAGFKRASFMQTISTFLARWGREMGFKGSLEVVPNAVDTKRFSQEFPEETIREAQSTLGKKPGDVFLVTTSRLVHKNAIDDVIRALPLLPAHIHFIIFGIGPDEEKLKLLARSSGVESRTHFLGQLAHEDMPKMLKACDIFIRPSRSEGMGNSFVEAFAAELPVIATQEGGIADLLFDEKRNPDKVTTGWAVAKDSPKDIARAVEDILARPEKVKEILRNAKELAIAKYDWDLIARDMKEKVFDRMIKGNV